MYPMLFLFGLQYDVSPRKNEFLFYTFFYFKNTRKNHLFYDIMKRLCVEKVERVMYESYHSGWIECITGSMFSGKSEELIRRLRRGIYAKQKVVVFKPLIDDRYDAEKVVSHDGNAIEAFNISESKEILQHDISDFDIIGIDEVQFFDKGIVDIAESLAEQGHRVIVAGLDMDFRGEPFEPVPQLLAVSENITKLHAVCAVCGTSSSRTQRLIDGKPAKADDPIIMIGANESYEPRCRAHHIVAPSHEDHKEEEI